MNKCVFFDRDGIVNKAPPEGSYVEKLDDFEILPEFVSVLRKVTDAGYCAAVVTNQRCVARGIITIEEVVSMHERLRSVLAEQGIELADIQVCPHDKDDGCECRKPKPGMITAIAGVHGIDLHSSIMVGDHETDITAGRGAGCRTIRVLYRDNETGADFFVKDMSELEKKIESILDSLKEE
jgi:D-glycero-D-manno-heptose 1,7-bisphosphate phosphatase